MNIKQNSFSEKQYVGRFAPSPSGLLHFGSLLSALASYLDAKANHGKWLVRIDNIDPPREQSDAAVNILRTLEAFSLHWDDSVIYQSERFPSYINACIELIKNDLVYPCQCSRKELAHLQQYPGTCRNTLSDLEKNDLITALQQDANQVFKKHQTQLKLLLKDFSLRIRTDNFNLQTLDFRDSVYGEQQAPSNFGDFIILRKDSLPSYMLACGLDDLQDGVTHIVRGSDLLEASFWQRYLQMQYLQHSSNQIKTVDLNYTHLPLILNEFEQKLSKQHHAPEINPKQKGKLIYLALCALGQTPDKQLKNEESSVILEWAIQHWQIHKIPANNMQLAELTLD